MSIQTLTASRNANLRAGILAIFALLLAIFAFHDALLELVRRWIGEEEYSHGFLIPVVAAWLLWMRRDALLANLGNGSWMGPVLVLFAAGVHIVAEYTSIFVLSHLAFIIVIFGIALAAGGYGLLKITFIPIAFLIFSIPLPYFIEAKLTLQLQLISSQLGVAVINLFQIPVYLEGNLIELGNYKLQVVEACSGLRYLYPLLGLSFLAAYLFQAPFWQRALVFLSGIPITIGMNGFRIGMVGVTVDRWGSGMADEVLHFFEGWVIFVACAGLLVAEIFILARLSGRTFWQVFRLPQSTTASGGEKPARPPNRVALITCVLLLCASGLAVSSISGRPEFVPQRLRFALFPTTIGEWHGRTALLDQDVERYLGLDDYILSNYVKPDGKRVDFYVAYYSTQRNGYAPHSPTVCIPGGGWAIISLQQLNYGDDGNAFPFNRVIIERDDGVKQVVYYWFDERGRKIANEYWAKWYLLVDAIVENRTDGSLVRLMTQIYPSETEHDADNRLRAFMREVAPNLGAYLPSEQPAQAKSARSSASPDG
jgi:exosortase D (VPLPA-CTERM-specific)